MRNFRRWMWWMSMVLTGVVIGSYEPIATASRRSYRSTAPVLQCMPLLRLPVIQYIPASDTLDASVKYDCRATGDNDCWNMEVDLLIFQWNGITSQYDLLGTRTTDTGIVHCGGSTTVHIPLSPFRAVYGSGTYRAVLRVYSGLTLAQEGYCDFML